MTHCHSQWQNILKIVSANYPQADLTALNQAYFLIQEKFTDIIRKSGQTLTSHCLNVAKLLADRKMPDKIIIAGLLHDILEYEIMSISELTEKFGEEITELILNENKLDVLKYFGKEKYAENLRRMFLAMAQNPQSIFIKFADRIDNLKTLGYLPKNKQDRLATESLYIYAPIANRLGMYQFRTDLENYSFQNLYPEEYLKIDKIIKEHQKKREKCFLEIIKIIKVEAEKSGLKILNFENRLKSHYSIYRKAKEKNKHPFNIYDISAGRIIVKDIPSCYIMLGIIHRLWPALPDRFKDYIPQPKPNGYQALHTNIICHRQIVEIQIKTPEMHEAAEYGIAAHWLYKDKSGFPGKKMRSELAWIHELNRLRKNIDDHANLTNTIKNIKFDFFRDRIFVYTPKNDIIELPNNATPLDFAFAIHSKIGHHYLKAKVNGQPVKNDYILQSNESVEIITNPNTPTVKSSWLNIVKTQKAISEIKDYLQKNQNNL